MHTEMASLKSDLDQYLLQNETRKSYKISLPFSTPGFLSRTPAEDSPTSSSSAGTWLDEVQKEYFTLVSTVTYFLLLFTGIINLLFCESPINEIQVSDLTASNITMP